MTFENYLEQLDFDKLVQLWNEYASEFYSEHIYNDVAEFASIAENDGLELARKVFFGKVRSWDDHVYINGYGNFESCWDLESSPIDISYLAEWLKDKEHEVYDEWKNEILGEFYLDYLHDVMYVYKTLANNLVKTRESVDASEVRNFLVKDIQDLRKDLPENFSLSVGDLQSSEPFLREVERLMNDEDDVFKFKNNEDHIYTTGYIARLIHNAYKQSENVLASPLEVRAKDYALLLTSGNDYYALVKEVNELINMANEYAPLPSLKQLMIVLDDIRQAIIKWQSPYKIVDTTLWEIGE